MPTKKQLQQKVKELEAQLGAGYEAPIEPQDIVDWLWDQVEAPHPLRTSVETMMMWLQAMNTGLSTNNLQRRVGRVMELWRQQAIPNLTYTRQEQEDYIAQKGAYLEPVVLTTTWQQFLQAKKAKQEQEKDDESMDEEMQSSAKLKYSSIMSVDLPPVDPVVSAAGFTFAFVSAGTPPPCSARFGFSAIVSTIDCPPLLYPAASVSSSAPASTDTSATTATAPTRPTDTKERHGDRYALGPDRYASISLWDVLYDNPIPWNVAEDRSWSPDGRERGVD